MRGIQRLGAVMFAVLVAACASQPGPVPVVADATDLDQLAGEWSGYYTSPEVERHGSIVFHLEAGRDTARGDVVMVPRGWLEPLGPAENPAKSARDAPTPEVLKISFVRFEGDLVSGTMQPYRDPECGCTVYTTFTGKLKDGIIEGTFVSRPGHGTPYRGSWQVVRRQ